MAKDTRSWGDLPSRILMALRPPSVPSALFRLGSRRVGPGGAVWVCAAVHLDDVDRDLWVRAYRWAEVEAELTGEPS